MWVVCRELSVIFKPGTLCRVLRTSDQIHELEVKSMCFKEINDYTAN